MLGTPTEGQMATPSPLFADGLVPASGRKIKQPKRLSTGSPTICLSASTVFRLCTVDGPRLCPAKANPLAPDPIFCPLL